MHRILVIEDEESVRDTIVDLLEAEDFEVLAAENGLAGLQSAKNHLPDLIICDVMMPGLDGYGVLDALRREPATATIPLIFLSAKAAKVDFRLGMNLGAEDYLTKPFTQAELLGVIATQKRKQQAVLQHSEQKLEDLRRSISYALPHELLTPLNGIVGLTQLLQEEPGSLDVDDLKQIAQDLNTSAERLHRLVKNFLVYAQIELLAVDPQKIKVLNQSRTTRVAELITDLSIQTARQYCREEDLSLKITDTVLGVAVDDLKKIVEELVDNAFKFSKSGMPVQVQTDLKNNRFTVCITNCGRRMTSEQIADMGAYVQFERRFYEQQGMGLGLIIVRRLSELYGGRLIIESGSEPQTTVRVTLPVYREDRDPSRQNQATLTSRT